MPDLIGHLLNDRRIERNVGRHIAPLWINCFDKRILPSPFEVFKLFFAGDGLLNVRKCLEVNEFLAVVLLSERGTLSVTMLAYTTFQAVGYAYVF